MATQETSVLGRIAVALADLRGRLPRGWSRKVGLVSYTLSTISDDGYFRLKNEIKAFEAYVRLKPEEKSASEAVIAELESVLTVLSSSPNKLSVVGSHSTGLATPTSDIDFALFLPTLEDNASNRKLSAKTKQATRNALYTVQKRLHRSKSFSSAEIVFGRIPLVRAIHCRTGIKIQISTQSPDRYDREFTAAYLAEFATLRPLFMLLRYSLEMRNLNTPFEGGLGSYSILMMIVAALKQNGVQHPRDDLANHLLHVLDFYASADLYQVGFCIDPPRTFPKTSSLLFPLNQQKPYLLCLQDPADPTNDLGRKAYAIKHIQQVFGQARDDIKRDMKIWEQRTVEERKVMDGGLLNRLVRANYSTFEMERNRVRNSIIKGTKGVDLKHIASTEPKAPDLSKRASLRGLRKLGWGDEVTEERKRRGRELRMTTKKRRALFAAERKEEAKATSKTGEGKAVKSNEKLDAARAAKGTSEPMDSVPHSGEA